METLILIAYVVAGILVHIGLKAKDAITQDNKIDWKKHLIAGGVALVVNIVLLTFRDDIKEILPITRPLAFMLGFTLDSGFKNVSKFYGNKYKLEPKK